MSWDERAKCRNHPCADMWFPDAADKKGILAAKTVCIKHCPVRRDCAAAALADGERFGVRGGYLLEKERDALEQFLNVAPEKQALRCADCGGELANSNREGQRCWACIRGLVNAAVAQERIASMRSADWSWGRIASETGLNEATVKGIPRRPRITPDTEQKVLAVRVEAVA